MGTLGKVGIAAIAGVAVGLLASPLASRVTVWIRSSQAKALTPAEQERRYLTAFQAETRQPQWADPATAAIGQLFERAGEHGGLARLSGVECRAHSCVAQLEWQNRQDAVNEFSRIIVISSPALSGCSSLLALPTTEASPYRASLIVTECK